MAHQLKIKNLGPIGECKVELGQFNVLNGPQSNGKGTIARAVYFFRSFKQDVLNIMMQGGPKAYTGDPTAQWVPTLQKCLRDKFLQLFGTTGGAPDDMDLKYTFGSEQVYIHVYLTDNRYQTNRSHIYVEFSTTVYDYLTGLESHIFRDVTPAQMETEQKYLCRLLDDPYGILFIPAGRNLITLLSTQLNYIFTSLEASQLRTIDYVTKRFTEQILRLKPMFSSGMEGYIESIGNDPILTKKYVSNRPAIKLLLEQARKILNGSYRYVDGEERLYYDTNKYVKINLASSGQQEIVWVLNLLFYYLIDDKQVFVILEEPESHLYPDAQRIIGEILGLFLNEDKNAVLVTTHSPYLLGTFNYMLQAGQCSEDAAEKVKKKLRKRYWLTKHQVRAYFVHNKVVEDALLSDEDYTLIQNELIDGAAIAINEISDFILEQDYTLE